MEQYNRDKEEIERRESNNKKKIQSLKKENEKLNMQVQKLSQSNEDYIIQIDSLEKENAKLRSKSKNPPTTYREKENQIKQMEEDMKKILG